MSFLNVTLVLHNVEHLRLFRQHVNMFQFMIDLDGCWNRGFYKFEHFFDDETHLNGLNGNGFIRLMGKGQDLFNKIFYLGI